MSDDFTNWSPESSESTVAVKDQISLTSGSMGEMSRAATNAFYGINHRSTGIAVRPNSDNHGLTLFTRPRLNLSYDNISSVRNFSQLLTEDQYNLPRAIRAYLDTVSNTGRSSYQVPLVSSPLVDPKNPFISLMSNLLVSISGWPDATLDTHTSPAGIANETWSMVDSLPNDYSTYDLTANFKNITGDPITLLLHIWTQYASRVSEGSMNPWPDSLVENEIDYATRIYRLVLDPTKTVVQKIASCGYGFPYVNPIGAAFNFDTTAPIVTDNQEISVPFKCNGFIYNDPILVMEFNQLVKEFNPAMIDSRRFREMRQVPNDYLDLFNNVAYPLIREDGSMRIEWFVTNNTWAQKIQAAGL